MIRRIGILFLLGWIVVLFSLPVNAALVNFDDVTGGITNYSAALLPTDYAGFDWSSTSSTGYWGVVDNTSYRNLFNNSFDFPSNPNVVINEDGNLGSAQVVLSSATPFDLVSAYFSAWTLNSNQNYFGASSLTLTGYLDGSQVGSPLTFNLAAGVLQLQSIDFTNVDRVTFDAASGGQGYYFLMDDMQYNNVPIPAAVWLLGAGVIGLIGVRRRMKS